MRSLIIKLIAILLLFTYMENYLYAQETTSSNENVLTQVSELKQFIGKKKFIAEKFYPGAMNEADRVKYQSYIDALASRLIVIVSSTSTKEVVLNEFKKTFAEFENADTEERERMLSYVKELMAIFDIQNSDGLLNKWMYGFDPNDSLEVRNANAIAAMSVSELQIFEKLNKITPDTALGVITKLFGNPSNSGKDFYMWIIGENATSAISFVNYSGSYVLVWISKGRFSYSRKL